MLVQLLFSINFYVLVLSPHPSQKVCFFSFLYLMGESSFLCRERGVCRSVSMTVVFRLALCHPLPEMVIQWVRSSALVSRFYKKLPGDSDEPTGLRSIYLVNNTAVINCTRDVYLRIILWESNETVSFMETCLNLVCFVPGISDNFQHLVLSLTKYSILSCYLSLRKWSWVHFWKC